LWISPRTAGSFSPDSRLFGAVIYRNIKTVGEVAGELSGSDITTITRFLNDLYDSCLQIVEIVKEENQVIKQGEQTLLQQNAITKQPKIDTIADIRTFTIKQYILSPELYIHISRLNNGGLHILTGDVKRPVCLSFCQKEAEAGPGSREISRIIPL
jgi:hypothetical protein